MKHTRLASGSKRRTRGRAWQLLAVAGMLAACGLQFEDEETDVASPRLPPEFVGVLPPAEPAPDDASIAPPNAPQDSAGPTIHMVGSPSAASRESPTAQPPTPATRGQTPNSLTPSTTDMATCSVDAGSCAPIVCFRNSDCRQALCVNARCLPFCEDDTDCQANEACFLGLCRPVEMLGESCVLGENCVLGEDCVDGSCQRRCLGDTDCVGCEQGPLCTLGYCGR